MRFEMLDVRRRQLARLDFRWLQKFRRVQQTDIFHAFRQNHLLAVMLSEYNFLRAAEMRNALLRVQ